MSIPKTSHEVEWGWMMPHDVFCLKSMKQYWRQQKYHMKGDQTHYIWKQQNDSFPMRDYSSNLGKWFEN